MTAECLARVAEIERDLRLLATGVFFFAAAAGRKVAPKLSRHIYG